MWEVLIECYNIPFHTCTCMCMYVPLVVFTWTSCVFMCSEEPTQQILVELASPRKNDQELLDNTCNSKVMWIHLILKQCWFQFFRLSNSSNNRSNTLRYMKVTVKLLSWSCYLQHHIFQWQVKDYILNPMSTHAARFAHFTRYNIITTYHKVLWVNAYNIHTLRVKAGIVPGILSAPNNVCR